MSNNAIRAQQCQKQKIWFVWFLWHPYLKTRNVYVAIDLSIHLYSWNITYEHCSEEHGLLCDKLDIMKLRFNKNIYKMKYGCSYQWLYCCASVSTYSHLFVSIDMLLPLLKRSITSLKTVKDNERIISNCIPKTFWRNACFIKVDGVLVS